MIVRRGESFRGSVAFLHIFYNRADLGKLKFEPIDFEFVGDESALTLTIGVCRVRIQNEPESCVQKNVKPMEMET